jgi:hypothetical protein
LFCDFLCCFSAAVIACVCWFWLSGVGMWFWLLLRVFCYGTPCTISVIINKFLQLKKILQIQIDNNPFLLIYFEC